MSQGRATDDVLVRFGGGASPMPDARSLPALAKLAEHDLVAIPTENVTGSGFPRPAKGSVEPGGRGRGQRMTAVGRVRAGDRVPRSPIGAQRSMSARGAGANKKTPTPPESGGWSRPVPPSRRGRTHVRQTGGWARFGPLTPAGRDGTPPRRVAPGPRPGPRDRDDDHPHVGQHPRPSARARALTRCRPARPGRGGVPIARARGPTTCRSVRGRVCCSRTSSRRTWWDSAPSARSCRRSCPRSRHEG